MLPRPTLRRVHETAAGNPFFALELGRAVGRRDRTSSPAEPLPVPERLHELLGERHAALPAPTRTALGAAAALSQPTLVLLAGAGNDEAAIRPALEGGVLELEGERVRFSHPLFEAAAYEAVRAPARRDLHRCLAGLVEDEEERIRHLALATEEPDEDVAAALSGLHPSRATVGRARRRPSCANSLGS